MKKFREYIYIDGDKVNSYSDQIPDLAVSESSNTNEEIKEVNATGSAYVAKLEGSTTSRQTRNYSVKSNLVERFVNWCEEGGDTIRYDNDELDNDNEKELLVLKGKVEIPKIGESIEAIELLKANPFLEKYIQLEDDERRIFDNLKGEGNFPIILISGDKFSFSLILNHDGLIGGRNEFMENLNREVTVIGRIDKVYKNEGEIEIYNFAKDYLNINRAIMRAILNNNMDDITVYQKGPLVTVTPILIYR